VPGEGVEDAAASRNRRSAVQQMPAASFSVLCARLVALRHVRHARPRPANLRSHYSEQRVRDLPGGTTCGVLHCAPERTAELPRVRPHPLPHRPARAGQGHRRRPRRTPLTCDNAPSGGLRRLRWWTLDRVCTIAAKPGECQRDDRDASAQLLEVPRLQASDSMAIICRLRPTRNVYSHRHLHAYALA
jgi:hypothetical protein